MEELLDFYMDELDTKNACYEMMGRLLDREHIASRIKQLDLKKVYVYGGAYMGIQLYRALNDLTQVVAIVDKSGGLRLHLPEIPVMNLDEFKRTYNNEIVIITPIQYYQQIFRDLSEFIPGENILFLGEVLEGK